MKQRLALLAILLAAGCFLFPRPPDAPEPPAGPGWALIGETGAYTTVATDRDSGTVSCRLDWGDGDVSDWSAWVPSGTPVAFNHDWLAPGSHAVRACARNSRGEASDWSDSLLVAVLDTPGVPSVVQRRFPLGSTPRQLALNPDGTTLFLLGAGSGANLLYILNADGTGNLAREVLPGGVSRFGLPATPGHLYAFLADPDVVLADLSLPDFEVLDTLPLRNTHTWIPPVVLPGDSLLCLAERDALLVIRTGDLLEADSIHIGDCLSPDEVVLDPATSEVFIISDYIGFVHRLDPLTGRILATLSTRMESRCLTMPPAGNLVYATNRRRDTLLTIRKKDLVVLAEHPLDCAARAISFAPSGNHYYVVTTEDTVSIRRTADHSLVRQLGETSTLPVVFSRDGLHAWVTNDSELVELGFPPRGGD